MTHAEATTSRTSSPGTSSTNDKLGEVIGQADGATGVLTAYLADVAAGSTTPAAQPHTPASRPTTHFRPTPGNPTPRRVEQLRAELPPPLEGTGTGRKTHGRWFSGDRPAQTLVSGEDDKSDLAAGYLARIGQERASIRAHVEIKLAALITPSGRQTFTGEPT